MKIKVFTLFLLFICVSVSVNAQLFPRFQSFREIKTKYFNIIFPQKSEPSAQLLATFADDVYEEISSIFGIKIPGRLPVTFAPYTDSFNGFYSTLPIQRIMLFDTAMDPEWTTFEDNLKGLFIHELVHAISLNTRGPFPRALHSIFGNWITPAQLNAPSFMVEGATVSFESLSGFGRANDPYTRQILRQAIYENEFHTPFQASGVIDSPGQSGLWYEYGGLFSTWLQQQYGMDKYTQLWRAMGRFSRFSFFMYRSGFYGIFNRIYNTDFLSVWTSFKNSLAIDDIEVSPGEILPVRHRFFDEHRKSFAAIAASQTEVFIIDNTGKIIVFNTGTDEIREFNSDVFFSNDIDVSADGRNILVSGYQRLTNDRFKAVAVEHDARSGRLTGRFYEDIYKARYFRNGVIGIASELHNNNIVFKSSKGDMEVLLRGNNNLMFSGPQVIDDERIVFITAFNGVRELLLYNYVTGELFKIENLDGDNDYWNYMRTLGISDGKLFFSHNANDRMYKLAHIDLDSMLGVFSDRDFSGGVFNPVAVSGNIYYRAKYFSGDGIHRFPETVSSLTGTQIELNLTVLNVEDYGQIAGINIIDRPFLPTRPYFNIKYMTPFNFWIPLPLLRTGDAFSDTSFDGFGLLTLISDPTDRNMIIGLIYADWKYRMAAVDILNWQTTAAGFPITLDFSDRVNRGIGSGNPYRETRINLNAGFSQIPGRWLYSISLGGGYARYAEGEELCSYYWDETENVFYYSGTVSFSNVIKRQYEMFGSGVSFSFRGLNKAGSMFTEYFKPRFEGRFRVGLESRFPLNFVLYGAYDDRGMDIYGKSYLYGEPFFIESSSSEYSVFEGLTLNWLCGAEFSLGIFSFEIQKNISHLYFNRFFCNLSFRNVLYNSNGFPLAQGIGIGDLHLIQSLVLKLGLVSSFLPFIQTPFFAEPNMWAAWKFSNTFTGAGSDWNFGLGFRLLL